MYFSKRVYTRALVTALLAFGSGSAVADAFVQGSGPDALVSMEAENFDLNGAGVQHDWVLNNKTALSQGSGMRANPNQGVNQNSNYVGFSPRLDYRVEFVQTGLHYLWVRGIATNRGNDSLHVGFDGAENTDSDRIEPATVGQNPIWTNNTKDAAVAVINVTSTGEHTINVWMREDGYIVDKLVLTTNPAYTPSGNGPPESARSSTGGAATPTIDPAGGSFVDLVEVTLSTTTPGASIYYTTDGSTPDTGSTLYADEFTLTSSATVNAIAVASGLPDSAVATASFVVVPSGGSGAFLQGTGPNALVSMEAENFDVNAPGTEHNWAPNSTASQSGGAGMRADPNISVNRNSNYVGYSPRLDYRVEFLQTGLHYVWIRGIGSNFGNDSLHVGFDGAENLDSDRIEPPTVGPNPVWTNNTKDAAVAVINVTSTGQHTINVWMREDGYILDKLVLTTNSAYVATGDGPPESSRGTGGSAATPSINPAGGSFIDSVTVTLATATSPASIYYTTDGTTPDTGSTLYGGAFTLTSNATVNAIAVASGLEDSAVATASFTVTPSGGSGAFQQGTDPNALVSMEAENFDVNASGTQHDWELDTTASQSGSAGMRADPNIRVNRNSNYVGYSPRLDYRVEFLQTGVHYVWVRGIGSNFGNDSLHVGFNGAENPGSDRIEPLSIGPNPVWTNNTKDAVVAMIDVPSVGEHTINVWMREDGYVVDKLVLTTNPGYTPNGSGPPESPRGSGGGGITLPFTDNFSDGNANGWSFADDTMISSSWTVTSGQLRQTVSVGVTESAGALDGLYHLGTYALLDNGLSLTDYRLSLDLRLNSTLGDECGVMWRYQGGQDYYRVSFSLRDGFGLLQKRVGSAWTTLAKNGRGLPLGQLSNLVIDVVGPNMQVRLDGQKLFAARDADLSSGSIALYGRDVCHFDNVSLTNPAASASVAFGQPADFSVVESQTIAVSAVVINKPIGAEVDFEIGGVACAASVESAPGLFESSCTRAQSGEYSLRADLINGGVIDSDVHASVALGGSNIASQGDSNTNGRGDTYQADGSTASGRRVAHQGYQSNLEENAVAAAPNTPAIVFNGGVGGDRVLNLSNRVSGLVEQHPEASRVLVSIGTNDALGAIQSGFGCSGAACNGTYYDLLQDAVNAITGASKVAWVAKVPPIFGNASGLFDDPENTVLNGRVREYNDVIDQQLTGYQAGPDLYDFFLGAQNRVFLFDDEKHFNGLGHAIYAGLWQNALVGSSDLPFFADALEVRIAADLMTPLLYKQNLIDEGDPYFIDDSATVTSIPSGFSNARWIMTRDSDLNVIDSDYLRFDLGTNQADVYVAYDASASLPGWMATGWVDTGLLITTTHAGVPSLRLYESENRTSIVQLGGPEASSTGAGSNYVVLIVED